MSRATTIQPAECSDGVRRHRGLAKDFVIFAHGADVKQRIERHGCMPIRQDGAIPIRAYGLLRIEAKELLPKA